MKRIQLAAALVEGCFREGASTAGRSLAVTNGLPEGCQLAGASFEVGNGILVLDFAEPSDPPGRPGRIHVLTPAIVELRGVPPGTVLH